MWVECMCEVQCCWRQCWQVKEGASAGGGLLSYGSYDSSVPNAAVCSNQRRICIRTIKPINRLRKVLLSSTTNKCRKTGRASLTSLRAIKAFRFRDTVKAMSWECCCSVAWQTPTGEYELLFLRSAVRVNFYFVLQHVSECS